nr:ISNCY family transposase [Enterocloster clostridioformis]
MITYKQLSLKDIFADCQNKFDNDKYAFLELLDNAIDLDQIVPVSFISHFHAATGRPRKHLLYPMLTRFKQDFLPDLQSMFSRLVDLTEPICQKIDKEKASMLLFDTSGIEAWVTENNPKYANHIIRQLKAYKKAKGLDGSYDPYKAAYGSMPPHATSNPAIQQMYINGHFCYAFKFGILTNGMGIVRDITFYNKDFLASHPDIIVEKKSDSPDEDKSLADSKALIPVLKDFFQKHPLINPKTFLGDAAFDSIEIYKYLLEDTSIEKACIPLNGRISLPDAGCPLNGDGIPCCPKDPSLPMKREGSKSHLRCGLPTMKFVCPKMKWEYNKETGKSRRVCHCENPCTDSSCGRMFYIYPEKNLRAYPGTLRGTQEWNSTYKIRVNVEKSINHFKDSFCVAGRKTQNEKTLHADLLLAGITQLITVMVADKIHKYQYIRSLKPLIA